MARVGISRAHPVIEVLYPPVPVFSSFHFDGFRVTVIFFFFLCLFPCVPLRHQSPVIHALGPWRAHTDSRAVCAAPIIVKPNILRKTKRRAPSRYSAPENRNNVIQSPGVLLYVFYVARSPLNYYYCGVSAPTKVSELSELKSRRFRL